MKKLTICFAFISLLCKAQDVVYDKDSNYVQKIYHANGKLNKVDSRDKKGEAHGTYQVWNKDGVKIMENEYDHGQTAKEKQWWDNGTRKREWNYKKAADGRYYAFGACKEWFKDGKPYTDYVYGEKGNSISEKTYYSEGGLKKEKKCSSPDICAETEYFPNGKKKSHVEKNGTKVISGTIWDEQGNIKKER